MTQAQLAQGKAPLLAVRDVSVVFGGIIASTVIAIFYVPLFFVLVLRLFGDKGHAREHEHDPRDSARPSHDDPAGASA